MKLFVVIALAFGIFTFSPASLEATEQVNTDVVASGTYAVPLKKFAPKYPKKALNAGIEGWVVLNFIVKEDGTTDEIMVVDTSIENYFEEAAIDAVSNWIYEPATLNGEPVIDGNKSARTTFIISNKAKPVKNSFLRKVKKVHTAIKENDLPTARALIDKLEDRDRTLLAELFYLDFLESWYWRAKEDNQAQLRHVNRALVLADEFATKEAHLDLLRQAVVTNARASEYRIALNQYKALVELGGTSAGDSLQNFVSQIEQILNGDGKIVSSAEISECKYCSLKIVEWRHTLNRNRFYFDKVEGELSEIEVECGFNSVSLIYEPEIVWTVNQNWDECIVKVYGANETKFQFNELPFSSSDQETAIPNLSDLNMPKTGGEASSTHAISGVDYSEYGDISPIVIVHPIYPRDAARRGQEGWVKIEFTINLNGRVRDPQVIESSPPRVFDQEAINAIQQWRFEPVIVDGVAVERQAVQVIDFSLNQSR